VTASGTSCHTSGGLARSLPKWTVSAIDNMHSYKQAMKARIKAPKVTSRAQLSVDTEEPGPRHGPGTPQ
jgi:hypothetical protein